MPNGVHEAGSSNEWTYVKLRGRTVIMASLVKRDVTAYYPWAT